MVEDTRPSAAARTSVVRIVVEFFISPSGLGVAGHAAPGFDVGADGTPVHLAPGKRGHRFALAEHLGRGMSRMVKSAFFRRA
jgi:hypothetical protein